MLSSSIKEKWFVCKVVRIVYDVGVVEGRLVIVDVVVVWIGDGCCRLVLDLVMWFLMEEENSCIFIIGPDNTGFALVVSIMFLVEVRIWWTRRGSRG